MTKLHRLDIDRIAFIGRTYNEYMKMFNLKKSGLKQGPVLDCPAGAASFAAEAYNIGGNVTACDILYGLKVDQLVAKGREDILHVFDKFNEVPHLYTWDYYKDKDEVISLRTKALKLFAQDFVKGLEQGRYRQAALPHLPFPDRAFPLVLSGHFLFLYGDRLDFDFHIACLKELVRVSSSEVRIYPLQGLDAKPYPHIDYVFSFLKSEGIPFKVLEVPFEFQRGADKMLILYRR